MPQGFAGAPHSAESAAATMVGLENIVKPTNKTPTNKASLVATFNNRIRVRLPGSMFPPMRQRYSHSQPQPSSKVTNLDHGSRSEDTLPHTLLEAPGRLRPGCS